MLNFRSRSGKRMLPVLVFYLLFWGTTQLAAQPGSIREEIVKVSTQAQQNLQDAPQAWTAVIMLSVANGWHINAHKPLDEFLIPTAVTFASNDAVKIGGISYPKPRLQKFDFSEKEMAVYAGEVTITAQLQLDRDAHEAVVLEGALSYQACNAEMCLAPQEVAFSVRLEPARAGGAEAPFTQIPSTLAGANIEGASRPVASASEQRKAKVEASIAFSHDKIFRGSDFKAAILLNVADGWHINSHTPRDEFLIPTEVVLNLPPDVELTNLTYPPEKLSRFSFSEEDVAVYEGTAAVIASLHISGSFAGAEVPISGTVKYQACNDVSCLAPDATEFAAALPIAGAKEAIALINRDLFEEADRDDASAVTTGGEIGDLITERGYFLTFLLIFVGGLALNLTPCVYPLIPITISFFGGQARGSTARVFTLALAYLLGMSITYSAMGVAAALSGSLFGSLLQNPIVLIGIAAIMLALAASMFGYWELSMPQFLYRFAGGSRQGYAGSLFMGLTVGIVAAPCIGPFVLGLLTFVGTTGDPVLGFWMFFVLSLGLGLPYLVLGTFSGAVSNLPRSGLWMVWVKKVFGIVLIAMAAYFINPLLSGLLQEFLLPAVLLAGGIAVGFLDKTKMTAKSFPFIKSGIGALLVVLAVWLGWPENAVTQNNWQPYSRQALTKAIEQGQPVIIDFTAEWCIACKELEKLTFPSPPVQERADKFLLLRADLTKYASPPVEQIKKEFNIKGLPMVIFIGAGGTEVEALRVIGFVKGEEFARRMDTVLAN